ncbi:MULTISPECIES: hypothetical protein [unclassified Vibrio]|uniref:hypothetical protein n=1 Tax=unclassified Vibrio TaxID=2614977 RepID=UPI00354C6835
MDFKEEFSTILVAVMGSTALIGFLAKLFANSLASAAIKRFELINAKALEKQKLEHEKQLEDIKSQLTKLQKEHEVVFANLYVKREKAVITLYKQMNELALLADNKLRDSSIEIDDKCRALIEHFELSRLYFPRDIASEINNVINTVYHLTSYENQTQYEQLVFQLKIQVFDQMESTFRKLLKIEDYR